MAEFSREFSVKAFKQEVYSDGFVIRDRSIYPTQTRSSARGSDCDATLQSESGGFVTVVIWFLRLHKYLLQVRMNHLTAQFLEGSKKNTSLGRDNSLKALR